HLWVFPKRTEETVSLSKKMMDFWISFAKTGNPNHKSALNWPQYNIEKRKTIIFNTNIEVIEDPYSKEREIWNTLRQWAEF
ncbi:MAG: carboxylesterase family protein, partial [Candidatus Hodarchaeota archaeon]